MMDESEKRRERLKAMRMEATQAGGNGDCETPGLPPASLSNPLIESETVSATPLQYTSPRFDYYTDPMSAFTGSKTRDYQSPQPSQGYYNIPPRPGYQSPRRVLTQQNPVVNSSGQRTFPAPGHFNHGPQGSPMDVGGPFGRPQRNPHNPAHQNAVINSQGQGTFPVPGHFNHGPQGSPMNVGGPQRNPHIPAHQNAVVNSQGQGTFPVPGHFNQGPRGSPMEGARPFGRPQGNPPGSWGRSSGSFHHSTPNYRNDTFSSPSVGQNDSSYYGHGGGRDQRYNNSSHNDTGYGGGRFSGSGRGRGRSRANAHNSVSAEIQPNRYYNKAMMEDPWKELEPVIWKGVEAVDSNKSWLPKSFVTKKPKVSSEPWKTSSSQPSLAEYLAASFSDSIDETVGDA